MGKISQTIKSKSDQLNAEDLLGGAETITIEKVVVSDSKEQPVSIFYKGCNNRPYKPNLTFRKALVVIWGDEEDLYIGRQLTVWCNQEVKWAGEKVGGIEISHASHIDKTQRLILKSSKSSHKKVVIEPIKSDEKQPNKQVEKKTDIKPEPTAEEKLAAATGAADKIVSTLSACSTVAELNEKLASYEKTIEALKKYDGLAEKIQDEYLAVKTRLETPHDVETGEVNEESASDEIDLF